MSLMPQPAVFQFENAGKVFLDRPVLVDFNLAIGQGGFHVLLGPSGCGKSTVLRLMAGLEDITSGRIIRPPKSRLSFVFQDPRLLPWRTVRENILLPFELTGLAAHDPRPWLEKVGLWRARDFYPHQLSGGMRMRASLARALITEPDVLLMDEPLSALDEVTREDLQDFIRELWLDRPFTAVFVTHSLREAVYLGRHLVIMSHDGGRILYDQPMPDSFTREGLRDSAAFQTAVADLSRRFRGSLRDKP